MKYIFLLLFFMGSALQAQSYHFITKKELVNDAIVSVHVGYVLASTDADAIHQNENGLAYESWIESNMIALQNETKQLKDFFTESDITVLYEHKISASYTNGRAENEIININNLP